MPVLTVRPTGSTAIGRIRSAGLLANYNTIKETYTAGSVDTGSGDMMMGQWTNGTDCELNETFFQFSLASLPVGAFVSSLVFEFTKATFNSSAAATQELLSNSAGAITSADWVAFSNLAAKTNYGTIPTSGYRTADTTYQITLTADARTAAMANAGGTFDFMIASGKMITSTAPTGSEQYQIWSDDNGTAAYRPAIIVTYTTNRPLNVGMINAGVATLDQFSAGTAFMGWGN